MSQSLKTPRGVAIRAVAAAALYASKMDGQSTDGRKEQAARDKKLKLALAKTLAAGKPEIAK